MKIRRRAFFMDEDAMLDTSVVDEVQRMLDEGTHSQRHIARLLKLSRGTVLSIANGRRPDYELLRAKRQAEAELPEGPLERCPTCGGMAYMPCRLCLMRARAVSSPRKPPSKFTFPIVEPLGLDLRAEHQSRYEEVRSRRMLLGELLNDEAD
jgi:hypothetical protein